MICARGSEIAWDLLLHERFTVSQGEPGPEIHNYLIKRLSLLGRHPTVRRIDVGREALMPLVALNFGLIVTTEATVAASFPGVAFRRISDSDDIRPFSAILAASNDNPVLRRFLSFARVLVDQRDCVQGEFVHRVLDSGRSLRPFECLELAHRGRVLTQSTRLLLREERLRLDSEQAPQFGLLQTSHATVRRQVRGSAALPALGTVPAPALQSTVLSPKGEGGRNRALGSWVGIVGCTSPVPFMRP